MNFFEKGAHIELVLGRRDAVRPRRGLSEDEVKTVERGGNEMQKLSSRRHCLYPSQALQLRKDRRGLDAGFQR